MKILATIAIICAANTSHAIKCMGSGQKFRMVRCEITSTKTYEAGYTEEYGKAIVTLMDDDTEGTIIDMGLATGNVQARVSVENRSNLKLDFNQDMGSWGKSTTQKIIFPTHICGGEIDKALNTTTTYVADFKTHAMNLDLNVDCKSYSYFQNEP